ncbi:MAG: CBS domain-containing protein [Chloroflexi bacterium]|nr:CBS domain-containing protein [Chloroflexota bacterium]
MQIRDIMGKELYYASPTSTVRDVAQIMLRHNIGALPICNGNKLMGIVTDRDLAIECCTANVDPQTAQISEFMTVNPVTARPDMDLKDACELMAKEQIRRLPVVDGGKLVGVISLGDLAVSLPGDPAVLDALARISVPCRVQNQAFLGKAAGGPSA